MLRVTLFAKLLVLILSVHCLLSKDIFDIVRMDPVFEPPSEALLELPQYETILEATALNLLPKSLDSTVTIDLTRWFSKVTPNTDIGNIKHLIIPSDTILSKLSAYLGKAWDDGQQLLVFPHGTVEWHLPLWVVQYWVLASESIVNVS